MGSRWILGLVALAALGALAWIAGGGREPVRGRPDGAPREEAGVLPGGALEPPEVLAAQGIPASAAEREVAGRNSTQAHAGPARVLLTLRAMESGRALADIEVLARANHDLEPGELISWSSAPLFALGTELPRTDRDGRVELELSSGVPQELHVDPFGRAHVRKTWAAVPALAPGERFELELALVTADDLRWFGRVLDDASGAFLGGVRAEWRRRGAPDAHGADVSAADGLLVIPFASWQTMELVVAAPGYLPTILALGRGHASAEQACPIRLVRAATLEVRVRDALGAPLPDVRVELDFPEPADFTSPSSAPADVRWTDLGGGTLIGTSPQVVRAHGELSAPADFRFPTVSPTRREQTDHEGSARFEDLPPRQELGVAVRAGLGRTQRQSATLAPGESRVLEFVVGSGCRVQGLAEDEHGRPLSELDLWRLGVAGVPAHLETSHEGAVVDKARTDARGRFVFENVPAGDWWIGPAPYHRRSGIVALATRVTIEEGERVRELRLVCRSARYIRGRVLSANGRPVEAVVTASQAGESLSAQSTGDGSYQVGPLASGAWHLTARRLLGSDGPSELVRAEAGQSDVLLRLREGVVVSGVVLDEHGAPVPEAEVALSADARGFWQATLADEEGRFSFGGQAPGTYALRATFGAAAGVLGPFLLEAGREPGRLSLRLVLGAELCLRLASSAPAALELRVSVNGAPLTVAALAPGGERRERLPPGAVRVQLLQPTEGAEAKVLEEQRVELRAGETTVVELGGSGALAPQSR